MRSVKESNQRDLTNLQLMISKRKFWQARTLAGRLEKDCFKIETNANFWFAYGMSIRLTKRDESKLAYIRMRMRGCKNNVSLADGDWLRDDILFAIRKHNFNLANALLPELEQLHQNDQYRQIAIMTIKGMIAYHQNRFSDALRLLKKADSRLNKMEICESNPWFMRNKIYLLKTMVSSTESISFFPIIATAKKIIDKDKSLVDRFRAWLIIKTGRFGNTIDDLFVQKFA